MMCIIIQARNEDTNAAQCFAARNTYMFSLFSQTLYNSVIEEKITIEQVNTMGARLAKEAKVCFIYVAFNSKSLNFSYVVVAVSRTVV